MRYKRSFLLVVLNLLATCVIAQVAVIESDVSNSDNTTSDAAVTSTTVGSSTSVSRIPSEQHVDARNANAELYYQLEFLQQEVQALRGVVEELSYQMKQLKQEQKDRYLDLDRRLSQVSTHSDESNTTGLNDLTADVSDRKDKQAITTDSQATATQQMDSGDTSSTSIGDTLQLSQTEPDVYRTAYHLLLRKKAYKEAIESFKSFLIQYPDGKYAANAYYWLGEAYLVENDLDNAKDAFSSVISRFPGHRKAPGAMYKLGTTYFLLNDMAKAKELLQQVETYYPGSSAAKLAAQYIRDHSIR